MLLWLERLPQRRYSAALDDRLLVDMGVSRADAARECGKPFFGINRLGGQVPFFMGDTCYADTDLPN
ncbi:MAG: DUF1127 domain-containing protein [Alphaproteobacteria bacterium]|nr:DUF1127 domain-containing protein [Alphaproteobacteria bacterium]